MSIVQPEMIYEWEGSERYPDRLRGDYKSEERLEYIFLQMARIVSIDAPLEFRFFAPSAALLKYDYLENTASVPLVSPLVANLLRKRCGDAIQLLAATAYCRGGETIRDYQVVNVLRLIPAVNNQKSRYEKFKGFSGIVGFDELVLLPNAMRDEEIGRLEEYSSYLLVNNSLRQALLDAGARNLRFSSLKTSA